jgi:hypothetical protein
VGQPALARRSAVLGKNIDMYIHLLPMVQLV